MFTYLCYFRWTPKADIVMTFWEYFHKKLNSSFYVSGMAPKALAITRYDSYNFILNGKLKIKTNPIVFTATPVLVTWNKSEKS